MTHPSQLFSIAVVGSSGAFGSRIAELLSRVSDIDLVLAGRTAAKCETQARLLSKETGRGVRAAVLDAEVATADDVTRLGVNLLINASGPFQGSSYALARAAIAAGCHYIDLADARDFVTGFSCLDADARARGVLAVSGASSVPGLSTAVVQSYRDAFQRLDEIDIAISPGNAFDPGGATVTAVLGGVGQPIQMLHKGAWEIVYGWQGLRRGRFGAAGTRWLGYVDVPDLALLPSHVPEVRTVRFQAGLEVSLFHLGLWAASWILRSGAVRDLKPLASPLLAVKRRLGWLGSDRGGMFVTLRGLGLDNLPKALTWTLVARNGHGPYVPALASVALARRIALGQETRRGAFPCTALLPLDDILAEARDLDILTETKETPPPR